MGYNAYSYHNVNGAGTTVIKTGPGVLHSIVINSTGAATFSVWDNTEGTGSRIAAVAASPAVGSTFMYDVAFSTGLTIITNAAAYNITVSYN